MPSVFSSLEKTTHFSSQTTHSSIPGRLSKIFQHLRNIQNPLYARCAIVCLPTPFPLPLKKSPGHFVGCVPQEKVVERSPLPARLAPFPIKVPVCPSCSVEEKKGLFRRLQLLSSIRPSYRVCCRREEKNKNKTNNADSNLSRYRAVCRAERRGNC
ncbi:uncharacterized protein BDZ99DRAFT_163398 [Mytilinidion resinicola]|uniref:Uncharacterized protein n=1 Tax=Mytilinidion resinicola TaxID=574789 RepID=A0A6A6Y5B0_9PEZI|nr:uncharacterized protein BDZ99DRAFT_163398 [Mytilinidion resinicola]KAF2803809.1 hypothetical protein BDZ99DRAFT_163398 [Mytilinidion resinicola]